jgi:hypothetical protein
MWWLAFVSFLILLAIVRHLVAVRWRSRRITPRRAAIALAAPWALFPFLGVAVGAPWPLSLAAMASAIMFTSGAVAAYWLLSTYRDRDKRPPANR